jgi:hypothetical protein
MADKKISQLTGASTPLAGTEVLPIVQSGSTVKVASDDLTVKNVRSNATTGILQIAGPAAAATRTMTVPDANFTAARTDAGQTFTGAQTITTTGNAITTFDSTNANGGYVRVTKSGVATGFIGTGYELFSPAGSSTDLGIRAQDNLVFSAGGGTEGFRLNTSGNIVIKTAGKGIDFSANTGAAGETSSLLNWYEEGTWTPAYTNATPPTTPYTMTVSSATYTRIGRQVTVRAWIYTQNVDTTGASGALQISGLPFAAAAGSAGYSAMAIGQARGWVIAPSYGYVDGSAIILMYRTAANVDDDTALAANLTTGASANKNQLMFTATYFV